MVYDVEIGFQWIRRNIHRFGGDPDRITIAGASAGAGLASVVSSLSTVAHDIVGIVQLSGDGLAPTTGFMPPTSWENDQLYNLKTIGGYNKCDSTSEESLLECLRQLDQEILMVMTHKLLFMTHEVRACDSSNIKV